jgi:hypothetical protein
MNTMPKVGSLVRLINGRSKQSAKVVAHLDDRPDYIGGGLRLDRRLDGFQYWNMLDVEPADE